MASLFLVGNAAASTGIAPYLSFEGKVVTSSGQNITDGTYNMEFRIYTGCTNEPASNTGCTPVWTEDWLDTGTNTGGVTLTSGTFQVNLGSLCPLSGGACSPSGASGGNSNSAVNWNSYPLYLSMQVGNNAACTNGTNNFTTNCSGDGVMNPYILLTSTPYAFNASELGGLTSSQYIQTTPTTSQTIQPTTNVSSLIVQQNNSGSFGQDVFEVQGSSGGSNNFIQVTSSAANAGNVTIAALGATSTLALQAQGISDTFTGSTTAPSEVIRTTTNSTGAFQIQSSTATLLNADTANMRLGVVTTFASMSSPVTGLTVAAAGSGSGSLSNGTTYFYKVTAIDSAGGETAASTEASAAATATGIINLYWTAIPNASGYRIYRSTSSGGEVYLTTVLNNYGSGSPYQDNGTITPGTASPPTTNTAYVSTNTGNNDLELNIGGNGTPTGQEYVSGNLPSGATGSLGLASSANPFGVFTQGSYAYVIDNGTNTLQIIDISSPAAPTPVGSISTSGAARYVYVQGKYAYVTNFGNNTIQIIDVSNPASPTSIGTFSLGSGAHPIGIYVQGRYAYIANNGGNTMQILDVANPTAPFSLGSVSTGATSPYAVYVQGRYAYVTEKSGNQIQIIDVSNPLSPSVVSTLSTGSNSSPLGIYVQGRYAYVTDNSSANSAFQVIDVSNPSSPSVLTTISTGAATQPQGIYVQGRYAYLTNFGTSGNSMQIFDVSNPYTPISNGTVSTGTSSAPYAISVQGRYAYVTNSSTNNLMVFDLGGAYIQQLQAGGAEVGTLQVDSNAQIYGDGSVQGGLSVGSALQVGTNVGIGGNEYVQGTLQTSGGIQGGLTITDLTTPSAPTVTAVGCSTGCTNTFSYSIAALSPNGLNGTPGSPVGSTTTQQTTLNSSIFNSITWSPISGAVGYAIYRTAAAGGSGLSTGLIGTTTATFFNDTGSTVGSGGTAPTADNSGTLTLAGSQAADITVSAQTSLNTNGNSLTLQSSAGNGAGNGGTLSLQAANSGTGATGNGGTISITGGNAVSTSGTGGGITLTSGTGTSGSSGSVIVGYNGSGSTTAFQVQSVSSGAVFTVDNTNADQRVTVGGGTCNATIGYGKLCTAQGRSSGSLNAVGTNNTINISGTYSGGTVGGNLVYLSDAASGTNTMYGFFEDATSVTNTNDNLTSFGANIANASIPGSFLQFNAGGVSAFQVANSGAVTTRSITNSTSAFQIQDTVGAPVFTIDTTSTDPTGAEVNYLSYPGFEVGTAGSLPTGWSNVSPGATVLNNNRQHVFGGLFSAQLTTTVSNGGLSTTSFAATPPTGAKTYIVSFYAEVSTGTMPSSSFTAQITSGSNFSSACASGITINANGFQRVTCTITTTAGTMTAFQLTQNDATARVIYIDSVQVQLNSYDGGTITNPTPYQLGAIQLRGVIQNPVTLMPEGDSTTEFQIYNAAGTNSLLNADTLNSTISLASTSTTTSLLNITNNSAATNIVATLNANALTTGIGLQVLSTSSGLSSGALAAFTDNSASTATGGLVQISGTSLTTGIGLLVTANTLSSGAAIEISSTATTATGGLEQIVGNSLTTGIGLSISGNALTTGAALKISSTKNTATGGLEQITDTALTTGIGELISEGGSITSGYGLEVSGTYSTSSTTGGLAEFINNSATTATAGLVQISGTALTTGAALSINAGTGTALALASSGSTIDLASGTAGNTDVLKIPQLSGTSTCASATAQGLIIKTSGGTQEGHICMNGSTASPANALSFWANAFNATSTDVAENYSDVTNNLQPGELVAIDPSGPTDAIVAATIATRDQLLGIISTEPGIELTGISEADGSTNLTNPKPVALTGRVPTLVSTENGPIQTGDYLTASSVPGVAMKATTSGMVVGRALEPYDGAGVGKIIVFTHNSSTTVNSTFNTDVHISGTMFADGALSVMGPADFYGESTFYKLVTFIDQTVFNNDVTFNGRTTFNNDTGGFAVIHKGQTSVQVTFSTPYTALPVVTVSDNDGQFTNYSYTNLTTQGFTIVIPQPAAQDMHFSWSALSIQNAKTSQVPLPNP